MCCCFLFCCLVYILLSPSPLSSLAENSLFPGCLAAWQPGNRPELLAAAAGKVKSIFYANFSRWAVGAGGGSRRPGPT